jgi:hypothetical protein
MLTVAVFRNNLEANIARGKLEAAGIYCILENEQTSSLWPGQYVDVKLKVPEDLLSQAQEILRSDK